MIEQITKYFESEYNDAKRVVENENKRYWWANKKEVVNNAIMRMLGVSMFVQQLDYKLSYDEIEILFNSYKEKLRNLLTD